MYPTFYRKLDVRQNSRLGSREAQSGQSRLFLVMSSIAGIDTSIIAFVLKEVSIPKIGITTMRNRKVSIPEIGIEIWYRYLETVSK